LVSGNIRWKRQIWPVKVQICWFIIPYFITHD